MAVIDPHSQAVVIRIAYDGAPMAGKSTSVRALGRGLGASVVTPQEVSGRTLYFDWLDYTGGLFEGRSIRCQVISVPGQSSLAPRRQRLLEQSDVVVYVGDSTPDAFENDRVCLGSLCRILGGIEGPPVGVVLQANKRDRPDAVPVDRIRRMLDELDLRVGVVESVATDGAGIREAFVFAVRLALDRVGELMRSGQLQTVAPAVNSADELLEDLRRHEGGSLDLAVQNGVLEHVPVAPVQMRVEEASPSGNVIADALAQVVRENSLDASPAVPLADANAVPATPDSRVPSGLVWPPVDGRLILNELNGARVELNRSARGDWIGNADGRWQLLSPADAAYDDVEAGRSVLVQSARAHAARSAGRVANRCVVLMPDGGGRFRLWNVARLGAGDESGDAQQALSA
ncbi:MAG TPA: GTPase domain-containing protein [Steroidobacteraceae bacterium]|nr:GTPase domain-containing protein [Steroidobacteraceae bacterium]